MDIVTEITENGEALNDGNNNNDIIPPSSINDNKEIQGFDVMPEEEDQGEDIPTVANVLSTVDNGEGQGVSTSSSSSSSSNNNDSNSKTNNSSSSSSSSSSNRGTYRHVTLPSSGSNNHPSTMPSPSGPSSASPTSSRTIRASVIIVTDSVPADGEVTAGK